MEEDEGEDGEGSISRWIEGLKGGDPEAARPLWDRYFQQMVRHARLKLRAAGAGVGAGDEEDAALSAFVSLCDGARNGRFPQLDDRDDLWRVLLVITARKAWKRSRSESRQKRGGGTVIAESEMAGADGLATPFEKIAGREPTPEFAALAAEQYGRLLDSLDETLREVAVRRMEGYTNDEIAEHLGCARRTVARRLSLIRETWMAAAGTP